MQFSFKRDEDTICALSTPSGHGGVAIVRVSGADAGTITRKIATFLPENLTSHKLYYGFLRTVGSDHKIDEVLISYFKQGNSFTGEETFEINCHGGEVVINWILEELIKAGARMAQPGEFSYRSFLNGKMDLVQAEGVLSLIQSQSKKAVELSLNQLQGQLSKELLFAEDTVIWALAQLEADIDFSDEDIEVVSWDLFKKKLQKLEVVFSSLIQSFDSGRLLSEGFRIAILGEPNVGKSSLLNVLAQEERAIVSEVPGTTRDVIETVISVAGVNVKFVDTAGIHETEDIVEKMGIERAKAQFSKSDLVILVGTDPSLKDVKNLFSGVSNFNAEDVLIVLNKGDLLKEKSFANVDFEFIVTSAKLGEGIVELNNWVKERVIAKTQTNLSTTVTSARQFEQIVKAYEFLSESLCLTEKKESPDLIAFELQECLARIHEVLGKHSDEEVLDRIFKEFCLGK